MTEYSIQEFLRTGRLGTLYVGADEGHLFAQFPTPASAITSDGDGTTLSWGCIDLLVIKRVVRVISINFAGEFPIILGNQIVDGQGVDWSAATITDVVALLDQWGGFLVPQNPIAWLQRLKKRRTYPMTVSPYAKLLFERQGSYLRPQCAISCGDLFAVTPADKKGSGVVELSPEGIGEKIARTT